MSDFGFEAYALGDLDPTGTSHPLGIARDLIATGKPRSALEVLAEHQKHLADDPDYLILCAEAWHAAGDAPRAQHALLGAIRVAPADPRPLQLLGDLLMERGEEARAKRVFEKAERLESTASDESIGLEDSLEETADDLIAAAEREERTRRMSVDPRRLLLVIAVLFGIGLLMSSIALFVAPESEPSEVAGASPDVPTIQQPAPIASEDVAPVSEGAFSAPPEALAPPEEASTDVSRQLMIASPEIVGVPPSLEVVRRPTKKPKPPPRLRQKVEGPPATKEEDFEAELVEATDASELTSRADTLEARGQLGAAAKFYRRALDIDPDYAPALVGIGRSLLRAEKYAEVMDNATRALQLARGVDSRPGLEAEALYQIGRVHHQRGEEDAARRLLRQSTSLPRAPADAWFYLGESLSRDNSPAARDAYEQYLKRKPNGHLSDRAERAIR